MARVGPDVCFEACGWAFTSRHGPIAGTAAQALLSTRGTPLPSMVFADNHLSARRAADGLCISFCAADALRTVGGSAPRGFKVAEHEAWAAHHREHGEPAIRGRSVDVDYDWTFWPTYAGTIVRGAGAEGGPAADECGAQGPAGALGAGDGRPGAFEDARLADVSEPIVHHASVTLYEDELDDAGHVHVSVRMRVMRFGFLVLLRSLLVVDRVLVRVDEHRYVCFFDAPSGHGGRGAVWRQHRAGEAAYADVLARVGTHAAIRTDHEALVRAVSPHVLSVDSL